MAGKPVFSEQVEQFATVVHALLQNAETRAAFAKEPLVTLKEHGIEFKDPAVAKRVEVELAAFAGALSEDDICPPWTWAIPRTMAMARSVSMTRSYVRTGPVVRATNITWAVKPGDIEDVIKVDEPRVDAFVTNVTMQSRIAMLEQRVVELEAELAARQ